MTDLTGPDADAALILDALDEGVLTLDGERVAGVNRALERMAGTHAASLVGRPLQELLADADGAALGADAAGQAARLRGPKGELVPVSVRPLGAHTLIVVDRTREQRLERELWRLAGPGGTRDGLPLGSLAGEVAGMIEHEIQTAVTVLRGYLRLLVDGRAGPISAGQKTQLRNARREADHIGSLVADLLELAAEEGAGELRIARKPERLRTLLERCSERSALLLAERDMTLDLAFELDPDELSIDPVRIEQVVCNLLQNAARYGPAHSEVTLAALELEEGGQTWACVSVVDQGEGVSADELERIFRPFVRGRAATQSGARGAGLGLAVCHAIARAHGGRVEALPDAGCGHFRLMLPLRH